VFWPKKNLYKLHISVLYFFYGRHPLCAGDDLREIGLCLSHSICRCLQWKGGTSSAHVTDRCVVSGVTLGSKFGSSTYMIRATRLHGGVSPSQRHRRCQQVWLFPVSAALGTCLRAHGDMEWSRHGGSTSTLHRLRLAVSAVTTRHNACVRARAHPWLFDADMAWPPPVCAVMGREHGWPASSAGVRGVDACFCRSLRCVHACALAVQGAFGSMYGHCLALAQ
jgi:hypothetical protein